MHPVGNTWVGILGWEYSGRVIIPGWEYSGGNTRVRIPGWEYLGGNTRVGIIPGWGYSGGNTHWIRVVFPTRRAWENPLFPSGIPTVYFLDVAQNEGWDVKVRHLIAQWPTGKFWEYVACIWWITLTKQATHIISIQSKLRIQYQYIVIIRWRCTINHLCLSCLLTMYICSSKRHACLLRNMVWYMIAASTEWLTSG